MILDLGNGRELKLPDDTSDETARQLGRLILVLEDRAVAAEGKAAALQGQIDELRREVRDRPELPGAAPDLAPAIADLKRVLTVRTDQMLRAILADRVIVYDSLGAPRSRAVINRETEG